MAPFASRARGFGGLLAFAAALLLAGGEPAAAQEGPDALVRRVSQEVLQIIRTDPQVQAGNEGRIREVIETRLLPHFDFARMTALAMGKNWRAASPDQQKRLTDEFRALLVRTYSGALNKYRDETIDYKPLRATPADTEVIVRTVVQRPGGQPVPIDYNMERKPDGWKAFDVVVGGVSLVTNYRDEFNQEIQAGGVDGLIRKLAERNKGAPAK